MTRPEILRGLPFADYTKIEAVNSSTLRELRHGPRECWHYRRAGRKATAAMVAGRLAHIQVLDPQEWLRRVVEWTVPVLETPPPLKWDKVDRGRYRTECGSYELELVLGAWRIAVEGGLLPQEHGTVTSAKAACKAHYERAAPRQPKLDADGNPKLAPQNPNSKAYRDFVAANPGREIVTRTDLDRAKRLGLAVRDNPEARRVLSGIWDTEATILWEHPETGTPCKARLDWLTDPRDPHRILIGDLKTCRDNGAPAFPRAAAAYEYHAQKAWYREGLRQAVRELYGTEPEIECVLLAVKSTGSHDSTVYDLSEDELAAGDDLNEERLQEYLELLDTYGEQPWPGKCWRALLNLAEHASWAMGDDAGFGGPRVDFGDIPT